MTSSSLDPNAAPGPAEEPSHRAIGRVRWMRLAVMLVALAVGVIALGVAQHLTSRRRSPDAVAPTATTSATSAPASEPTATTALAPTAAPTAGPGATAVPRAAFGTSADAAKTSEGALPELPSLPDAFPETPAIRAALGASADGATSAGERKEEVLALVERLQKDLPDSIESTREAATAYYSFGKAEAASRVWREYLAKHPQDGEANGLLGILVAEKGDYPEAVELLRRSLAAAPQRPDTRPALADALANLRRLDEAKAALEEDAKRFPNQVRSLFLLGRVCYDLGDYPKARQSYEAALRLEPDNTYAHHGMATTLSKLGEEALAEQHRERFRTIKRKDVEKERRRLAELDDAAEVTRRAAAFHITAGNVYAKAGMAARAEHAWRRAAAMLPDNVAARERLTWLYQNQHRLEESLSVADQLRKLKPQNADYCLNAGIINAQLRRNDDAESIFREAIRLAPHRAAGYAALMQLYLRTDRKLAEALPLAKTAVEREPTAPNYLNLCAAYERNGDRNGALAAIEKAISLEPSHDQYRAIRDRIKAGR